jgi:hypothetical protein
MCLGLGRKECIQNFGGETNWKTPTWKTEIDENGLGSCPVSFGISGTGLWGSTLNEYV